MKYLKITLISLLLIPTIAIAHGPSRQKVIESIEIDAAPNKVWEIISDFCSISDWNPIIKSCSSDNDSEINAIRTIELENGEKINEKLYKLNPEKRIIQYAMKEEKGRVILGFPVLTHGSTITVKENEGKSIVEWKGAFYRAFPGQQPPPELSDEACREFISKMYKSGLENIKAIAEK